MSSAASRAGIEVNDIISSVNGQKLDGNDRVQKLVVRKFVNIQNKHIINAVYDFVFIYLPNLNLNLNLRFSTMHLYVSYLILFGFIVLLLMS